MVLESEDRFIVPKTAATQLGHDDYTQNKSSIAG